MWIQPFPFLFQGYGSLVHLWECLVPPLRETIPSAENIVVLSLDKIFNRQSLASFEQNRKINKEGCSSKVSIPRMVRLSLWLSDLDSHVQLGGLLVSWLWLSSASWVSDICSDDTAQCPWIPGVPSLPLHRTVEGRRLTPRCVAFSLLHSPNTAKTESKTKPFVFDFWLMIGSGSVASQFSVLDSR